MNMCTYIKIAPHCRLAIECLEIKKKCRRRNSKLRGQASNKLGWESTLRHWLALIANRNEAFSIRHSVQTTESLLIAAECLTFSYVSELR